MSEGGCHDPPFTTFMNEKNDNCSYLGHDSRLLFSVFRNKSILSVVLTGDGMYLQMTIW